MDSGETKEKFSHDYVVPKEKFSRLICDSFKPENCFEVSGRAFGGRKRNMPSIMRKKEDALQGDVLSVQIRLKERNEA
jgi:hypothetical protein